MSEGTGTIIHETADERVGRLQGSVYVLDILGLLGSSMMDRALKAIWADPQWQQPWGFVLFTHEGVRYEPDLRGYAMPAQDRRSVNTAIVTRNQLHYMVIRTIGIGLRVAKSYPLEAYPDLTTAVEESRKLVQRARAEGRKF